MWFVRHGKNKKIRPSFEQVKKKILTNPYCYLTGDKIDISRAGFFHFDHIIPKSKGGTSSINNLGLASKDANMAKGELSLKDFLKLCKKVIRHFSTKVGKKKLKRKKKRMTSTKTPTINWNLAKKLNKPAMLAFVNKEINKQTFYEGFTYTELGGSIRANLRAKGSAKVRTMVKRALSSGR